MGKKNSGKRLEAEQKTPEIAESEKRFYYTRDGYVTEGYKSPNFDKEVEEFDKLTNEEQDEYLKLGAAFIVDSVAEYKRYKQKQAAGAK